MTAQQRRGCWKIAEEVLRDADRVLLRTLFDVLTATSQRFDPVERTYYYEGHSPHFDAIGDDEDPPEYRLRIVRLEYGGAVLDSVERLQPLACRCPVPRCEAEDSGLPRCNGAIP